MLIVCVFPAMIAPGEAAADERSERESIVNKFCPGGNRESQAQAKVINGTDAKITNWPGQVALRTFDRRRLQAVYFCSGTMIAPSWVLTAAHCAWDLTKNANGRWVDKYGLIVEAVIGVDNLESFQPGNKRQIADVRIHKNYRNARTTGFDVALIKLARPWSGPRMRISMSRQSDPEATANAAVMVAGFGRLSIDHSSGLKLFRHSDGSSFKAGSNTLQEVGLPVVEQKTCARRYAHDKISDGQICAGYEQGWQDSCQGDSGGPLVAFDKAGCPYQVGVVSWGIGCAEPRNYGVYTRVSAMSKWIREAVARVEQVTPETVLPPENVTARRELAAQALSTIKAALDSARGQVAARFALQDGARSETGNRVKLGERYVFEFTSNISGRLVIVDVDANGKVTQIFPNKFVTAQSVGRVAANEKIRIPGPGYGFDWFRATEPLGKGTLVSIIMPQDFPIKRYVGSDERLSKGFDPERSPANYLMNLAHEILRFLTGRRGGGTANLEDWAIAFMPYEIVK